jgi:hypothetical protein
MRNNTLVLVTRLDRATRRNPIKITENCKHAEKVHVDRILFTAARSPPDYDCVKNLLSDGSDAQGPDNEVHGSDGVGHQAEEEILAACKRYQDSH